MADEAKVEDEIPEELTITLKKAVEFGGMTFRELVLREPTAGQCMEWDGLTPAHADIRAVAVVSGIPEGAVKMIAISDLKKATEYLLRFL